MPRAYEEIALSHGDTTLRLRPSLRAATTLEAEFGLDTLFKHLGEFRLSTVQKIIMTATTDRGAADALMKAVAQAPLGEVARAFTGPLLALCSGFIPAAPQDDRPRSKPEQSATPITWAEVYSRLYKAATGWLLWTPEATWNATPTEIADAYEEHLAMLKAIHGSAEDTQAGETTISPAQREANVAEGLDPEFDRAGLRALKSRIEGGL
ncbi:hypothetical protein PVW46_11100 [Mameliella sp. AT18]|uniref:hypothetical protein n=1 Tax=Mameliella sp. AT18 TaxID=3028385 RepID=UPI00237A8C44|nr:hypothetical protein [Mameliella sp. AT18]MDD9730455.1 hypothetical protein [Mameliella sp. AT18]